MDCVGVGFGSAFDRLNEPVPGPADGTSEKVSAMVITRGQVGPTSGFWEKCSGFKGGELDWASPYLKEHAQVLGRGVGDRVWLGRLSLTTPPASWCVLVLAGVGKEWDGFQSASRMLRWGN